MTKIQVFEDLYLSLRCIMTYQFFLKKSCKWDRAKIKRYQVKKMKKLLIESGKHVPYYNQLFKEISFDPAKDFNKLEDIKKIPVLTKEIAKRERSRLDNVKYKKATITMKTSGSTGQPFEVKVSKNAWVMEQAVVWRHWKWSGYNFRDKMAIVRSYVPPDDQSLTKRERIRNFLYFSPFHLNDENMGGYLDKMIEEKVKVLRGYPSTIYLLADYVLRTNHAIPNIKLILVASEELRDSDRSVIEKAFKTKVTNHYGLAEICVMMGDCAAHNGMHNYDEHAYLELIDTEQEHKKRIVGTNLHNFATPLIRYDTGDLADVELTEEQKASKCDHNLTTINNISGRADVHIKTREGYSIATVNFYTLFESYQDVIKWQIIQEAVDKIEVRVLTESLSDDRLKQLRVDFCKRLPDSMSLEIKLNEPLIQKYEGKINPFISNIK